MQGMYCGYWVSLGHALPGELVAQDFFYFIGLLHGYADTHRVDARLDEYPFLFVSRDDDGCQKQLLTGLDLNLKGAESG